MERAHKSAESKRHRLLGHEEQLVGSVEHWASGLLVAGRLVFPAMREGPA